MVRNIFLTKFDWSRHTVPCPRPGRLCRLDYAYGASLQRLLETSSPLSSGLNLSTFSRHLLVPYPSPLLSCFSWFHMSFCFSDISLLFFIPPCSLLHPELPYYLVSFLFLSLLTVFFSILFFICSSFCTFFLYHCCLPWLPSVSVLAPCPGSTEMLASRRRR